ncbi:MAG TPA: DoxX family protein [Hanamia sp.]|nr:DoxX family protein [Hanamia sp.]
MSQFLSTKYSKGAFNFAMLVLRFFLGLLLASHGYAKLIKFGSLKYKFMNFMHLGSTASLSLIIFAELICGILLILGLFTRLACIPIIIGMSVVVFVASNGLIFAGGERGMIYLAATVTIFLCGPGKISVDGLMGK